MIKSAIANLLAGRPAGKTSACLTHAPHRCAVGHPGQPMSTGRRASREEAGIFQNEHSSP